MEFASAFLEDWMREYYFDAKYDIGSSGVQDYCLKEVRELAGITFAELDDVVFRDGPCTGDEALRQAVRSNRRTFGETVQRLRGKAEMHLKVVIHDGSLREVMTDIELPATVGGEYLSKLRVQAARERERQTKARALSVQVHRLFNPLDEEITCKKVDSDGMLIDIAHLIEHKSVDKYQNRYTMAAKQLKNCEILISGPWPPYHFLPGKLRTVAGNS